MRLDVVDVVGVDAGLGVDLLEEGGLALSGGEGDALLLVSIGVRLGVDYGSVEALGDVTTLQEDGGDALGTAVAITLKDFILKMLIFKRSPLLKSVIFSVQ